MRFKNKKDMKKILLIIITIILFGCGSGIENPTIQINTYHENGEVVKTKMVEIEPLYMGDFKYDTVWYDIMD
jgi:hypothetical protein